MKKTKIAFLSILTVASLGFFVFLVSKQNTTVITLPTKVEAISPESTSSGQSPDGKKTLTMKTLTQNKSTQYTFYDGNQLLYTRILSSGKITIPFNTWSPDDKYPFIKEELDGVTNYYVLPAGTNVTDKFTEKFPTYTLQEVTGWAAPTLLVINAANDKGVNVSLWFDIQNATFIPLSNRFN